MEHFLSRLIFNTVLHRLALHGAHSALGLASASDFREEGWVFHRSAEVQGWEDAAARTLDPRDPMLEPVQTRRSFGVDAKAAARNHLPDGLMRPILAVPVGHRFRRLALALYGPHAAVLTPSLQRKMGSSMPGRAIQSPVKCSQLVGET